MLGDDMEKVLTGVRKRVFPITASTVNEVEPHGVDTSLQCDHHGDRPPAVHREK
jgi:hypothetical protein